MIKQTARLHCQGDLLYLTDNEDIVCCTNGIRNANIVKGGIFA